MGLLDRIRPQPRWKSPDPEVRAAGLDEMGPEDGDALVALLRDDPDARVRRAALARVSDPQVLAERARSDADERVRDEAIARLQGLACGAPDATTADAALEHISDARQLGAVVREAADEGVRRRAFQRLATLDDPRALGAVARQAPDADVRLAALERLTDSAALGSVPIRTEHRDVAFAAIERIDDPETLRTIVNRASQKSVQKRARAKLDGIEASARAADAAAREAADGKAVRDEQRLRICRTLELTPLGPAGTGDADGLNDALARAEAEWCGIEGDAEPEAAARFTAASDRLRAALEYHVRAREEAQLRREQRSGALHERVAVVEAVEGLAGDAPPARLPELRATWAVFPPLDDQDMGALAQRFERACRLAEQRHERWIGERASRTRLEELCDQAERLGADEAQPDARTLWKALREEWNDVAKGLSAAAELETLRARFAAAESRPRERDRAARAAEEQQARDNLARLEPVVERLAKVAASEGLALAEGERALRDIRQAFETIDPLPTRRQRDEMADRLKQLRGAIYPRVQELRAATDWKRWANVNVQEQLCVELEGLGAEPDVEKIALRVRDIQERWRQAADVPRPRVDELRARSAAAYDQLRPRLEAHFAQQAAERAENLRRREDLCVRAEALAESTDWGRTAQAFADLQKEWTAIGPVPQKYARALWKRFRGAADTFFTRRKQDLVQRKESWSANLEKKEALCTRAEALAESSDWATAAAEIKRLQAEWKTIGAVRRSQSETVWQRFRGACDAFFERYKHRDQIALAGAIAVREEVCTELEALLPAEAPATDNEQQAEASDIVQRVRQARDRWQRAPVLPRQVLEPLDARFQSALTRLAHTYGDSALKGSEFDLNANRQKIERLCTRVEALIQPDSDIATSSPAALAAKLREALASNTIGGRVDEEAKWRAATDDVRHAQTEFKRVGPVPGDAGRLLTARFQSACEKFFEQRRKVSPRA